MNANTHSTSKEFRKNIDIRQKVHHGGKAKKIVLPPEDFVYGLPTNTTGLNVKDLITYTYGNRAEDLIKKEYEDFMREKTLVCSKPPKVVPRFISPKVEEMKKKEEERKANNLDYVPTEEELEEQKKEEENQKPLYKLKMFQNVGSRVAESIKQFKTFKQYKLKKPEQDNGIEKIINKVQDEIKEQEKIEQPIN